MLLWHVFEIKFSTTCSILCFLVDAKFSAVFLHRFLVFLISKCFGLLSLFFIVISITFRLICPPTFFGCLSNSGTFTEHRTTSFIESTGVACSDSVSHNRVQVLSIPVLLLTCRLNLQMIVLGNQRLKPLRHVSCWTIQSEFWDL